MHKNKLGPTVLLILDGWGHRVETHNNAIAKANTPVWDRLNSYSQQCALLQASGNAVGLAEGQMGNSEVGHLCIGSGRIVRQHLSHIDAAIKNKDFFKNEAYIQMMQLAQKQKKCLHIIGLLSTGGVHSHQRHIFAALTLAAIQNVAQVQVHVILDGRDTPPRSALLSLRALKDEILTITKNYPKTNINIASVCGRYYAMDRDHRWERTKIYHEMITQQSWQHQTNDVINAVEEAYKNGENDEFIKPIPLANGRGISDQDVVLMMNFRADRMRQLLQALCQPDFEQFKRSATPIATKHIVTTTRYDQTTVVSCAFPNQNIVNTLGEHVARANIKQMRIAETEKYAHVTFFFNGGVETPFAGEERILVPSPKVATYDLKPEMSAPELTQQLITTINNNQHPLIICNYANGDMVGHTGIIEAAIKAVETIDTCLGAVLEAVHNMNGTCLITADHGNCEQMYDEHNQQLHTAHTTHLVPLIYSGAKSAQLKKTGGLADIAPTVLKLMDITPPAEMTGKSLLDFV